MLKEPNLSLEYLNYSPTLKTTQFLSLCLSDFSEVFSPVSNESFPFFSPFTVSPCDLSLGFDDEPTFFLTHIVFHGPNVASSHTSQTSNDNQSCLKAVLI